MISLKYAWVWSRFLVLMFLVVFHLGCEKKDYNYNEKVYFGIVKEGDDLPSLYNVLSEIKSQYSDNLRMIGFGLDWEAGFPSQLCRQMLKNDMVPVLFWKPWVWNDNSALPLRDVTSGDWDNYIESWAEQIRDYQYPVFIVLGPEFNHQSKAWSVARNQKNPKTYINMFRHVVTIFRDLGANNAIFVWNPNVQSIPSDSWNDAIKAFPGKEYVDWIALSGSGDNSFASIFKSSVERFSKRFPGIPLMISSFGAQGEASDRLNWFSELPATLKGPLHSVRAVLWQDSINSDDYRAVIRDELFDADISVVNDISRFQALELK